MNNSAKNLQTHNTIEACRGPLYFRQKINIPEISTAAFNCFATNQDRFLILNYNYRLLLINYKNKSQSMLECIYDLPTMLYSLGFFQKLEHPEIKGCFYLKNDIIVFNTVHKLIFFSLTTQYREESFQMHIKNIQNVFKVSDSLLLVQFFDKRAQQSKFMVMKWETRQTKVTKFVARTCNVADFKLFTIASTNHSTQKAISSSKYCMMAVLYKMGPIQLYDLISDKSYSFIFLSRMKGEIFERLYFFHELEVVAQISNMRCFFMLYDSKVIRLKLHHVHHFKSPLHPNTTAHIGNNIIILERDNISILSVDLITKDISFRSRILRDSYTNQMSLPPAETKIFCGIFHVDSESILVQTYVQDLLCDLPSQWWLRPGRHASTNSKHSNIIKYTINIRNNQIKVASVSTLR